MRASETVMRRKDLVLGTLEWTCRDIGYGVEEGRQTAYRTPEVDTWGKHTFYLVDADGDRTPIYLFRDEYVFMVQRRPTSASLSPAKAPTPAPTRKDGNPA